MQSILNSEIETADKPAQSSPPWVWFGFIFAIAFLVCEFLEIGLGLDEETFRLVFLLIIMCGWIYWAVCVYRFHKILGEMTRNRYPIAAGEAAGKHFIPFYNLYWLFAWTSKFSDHLSRKGVRMVPGPILGVLILFSVLLRFVDGALSLAFLFGVGLYISAKLKKHMKSVQGISP